MTTDDAPREEDESIGEDNGWMHYGWDEPGRPSTALIEAVAAATDRDPVDMAPLYEHVDVDALDALMTTWPTGTTETITVSFAYDGVKVRLDSDGGIEIQPDVTDRE